MMKYFTADPAPCRKNIFQGKVLFENEYISWIHDELSGQLIGAVVKNGSGENLLTEPLTFSIDRSENGKGKSFTAGASAEKVQFGENCVITESAFVSKDGEILPGVRLRRTVEYGEWGEAVHTLELTAEDPVDNVTAMRPAVFGVAGTIDRLGVRRRLICGTGAWSQNPCVWQRLEGGTKHSDVTPLLENHLPLSMTFLDAGTEALQFELGDDIAAWEMLPGFQEIAMIYNSTTQGYLVRCAAFIDRTDETVEGSLTLKFRLSLPFVRKNIVPLRRASSLLYFQRGFENRWPGDEDLKAMKKAGIDLLRLHCDGDSFKNGIFWRATVYPPFPAEEMKKMAEFLDKAHKYGIHVVPYFSVKEFHPDSPDYPAHFEKWGRRGFSNSRVRTNESFGSVMCLTSDWKNKRRASIAEVLEKHPFDGVYYDWCAGLECANPGHCGTPHWDNDELLEHLKWTADNFKSTPERYLHLTYVSSLAVENAATMVITEEHGFPALGPEMFTPHVHFLNIAPRQICNMMRGADAVQKRQLAMAALLHHASISTIDQEFLDFYASLEWLDDVERYTAYTAPGEGLASSSDSRVGVSVYWNDEEAMIVCANFREEVSKAEITVALPEKPELEETVELAPLKVKVIKCKLLVDRI